MHTDQGSEYTVKNLQAACARVGIKQSMGRAGSALDNAVIESWHSTVEFELRQLEHFATKDQARTRVATWIEEYHRDRRHSSLGMLSSQGTRSCLNHALALPTPGSPEALHTAHCGRALRN
jgi:transposase InsO family protein